jgi:hypothetical protein
MAVKFQGGQAVLAMAGVALMQRKEALQSVTMSLYGLRDAVKVAGPALTESEWQKMEQVNGLLEALMNELGRLDK